MAFRLSIWKGQDTVASLGPHPMTTSHHSWGMTGKNDSSLAM